MQGDLKTEGGTDITLLGKYKLADGIALNLGLVLPVCSADAADFYCTSTPAKPKNSVSNGQSGGQGKGYYQLNSELATNWLTQMDTRWFARVFSSITLSDDVFGNKSSSPFVYGFSFGHAYSIANVHNLLSELRLKRAQRSGLDCKCK